MLEVVNQIVGQFPFINRGFLQSLTLTKILGNLLACDLTDRKGRKFCIQLYSAIYLVGTGLTATATAWLTLSVSRLLGDLAVGIASKL
jgi:MFS family permease